MQGFNMGKYVPPEHEGVLSGNALLGKHALGSRARKASSGILTVRFEMPFAIWCETCPKPTIIGQGVRFNAEKKKVGAYYSTPVFSFRMKHTACGGWIEVRTDPQNTAYVVTEGARKRDTGEDKPREDEKEEFISPEERERRKEDAFAALEGKVVDSHRAKEQATRIQELQIASERDWSDTYTLNRRLRKEFRAGRKAREKEAGIAANLQDKYSLGMDLVPEDKADVERAKHIEFGDLDADDLDDRIAGKPMFSLAQPSSQREKDTSKDSTKRKTNPEKKAQVRKLALQEKLQGNTRLTTDPFLSEEKKIQKGEARVPPLKRRRVKSPDSGGIRDGKSEVSSQTGARMSATGLVDYDSDSA